MSTAPGVPFALLAIVAVALAACAFEDDSPLVSEATSALGRPVSASLNGWTIDAVVQHAPVAGNVRAVTTFDDNGLGGRRSGGTCLVADLDLGACDTVQDCLDAADTAGLPGNGGDPGWYHYCEPTGRETSPSYPQSRRCWSRPGRQGEFCSLGPGNSSGTARTVERDVTGIPGLASTPRRWTSISCLAGGTARDGSVVGDPAGCALHTSYVYVLDDPLTVPGL